MKETDDVRLAEIARHFLKRDECDIADGPPLAQVAALLKERVNTVKELADTAVYFYRVIEPSAELKQQHYSAQIKPALLDFQQHLKSIEWNRSAIHEAIKQVIAAHQLKMPKLAMPLRVMVTGTSQTPAIDATLELLGRERVLARMSAQLKHFPA
jgi:glutamyl-tRNA synthetase